MDSQRLQGKVAIVTGASSGIGSAITDKLSQEGASVVVCYRGNADTANALKDKIVNRGGKAIAVKSDVSKIEEGQSLIETAWSTFGKVDILVNNAGVEKAADFVDVTEADYDMVLQVNLKGPFFTTQAFVKRLLAANLPGRILNMSSVHEDLAFPHFSTYCASKGALRMLTRDLAVELGPKKITINNIAPGAIVTPINQGLLNDKPKLDALLANIPLGRLGTVDDVANLTAFLASDDAGYISGSTFTVDGALSRNYHEQ